MLYVHIPARDPDTESSALGALLMYPGAATSPNLALSAEDFDLEVHQAVFKALVSNITPGEHTSLRTLVRGLKKHPSPVPRGPSVLDALGLHPLIGLIDDAPDPGDIHEVFTQVRRMAEFRRVFPACLDKADWMCAVPDVQFAAFILCSDPDARLMGYVTLDRYVTLDGIKMPVIASRTIHTTTAWDAFLNRRSSVDRSDLDAKIRELRAGLLQH